MYKIKTLNKIDPNGLKRLPNSNYSISETEEKPDAIIVRSFKMHDMEMPSTLKAIARAGAGVNNIPLDKCTEKGIVVFNTPGANANAVKELVIAGMLMSSRGIAQSIEWARTLADKGDEVPALIEAGKNNFAGNEIKGKTIAIIGLGAIGILVANSCVDLGLNVIGYDPFLSVDNAVKLNTNVQITSNTDKLLEGADFVTINIPQNDKTKGFINAELIAKMKDGVKILNFARGGLVNNADMKVALESDKVASYICDFPDVDVIKMKKAMPIAHLGASTEESETNCAIMAADEVKDYLENGNIINSVNFPMASLGAKKGPRFAYASKNDAKIADITAMLGVKVKDMISKSRGDIFYTILDLDANISADSLTKIKSAKDIIFVHSLA